MGNVPSGGSALTGSRSPSPASMRAVTRCDEVGHLAGDRRTAMLGRGRRVVADRHGEQLGERRVDCGDVALHDDLAALAVGRGDRLLEPGDRLVGRQHAGEGEEARLHHGVDPAGEPGGLGDRCGVDRVQVQTALEHRPVCTSTGSRSQISSAGYGLLISTVAPGAATLEHVHALEEAPLVHADERRPVDEVGALDRSQGRSADG